MDSALDVLTSVATYIESVQLLDDLTSLSLGDLIARALAEYDDEEVQVGDEVVIRSFGKFSKLDTLKNWLDTLDKIVEAGAEEVGDMDISLDGLVEVGVSKLGLRVKSG